MSESVHTSSDTASGLSVETSVLKPGELFERKRRENKWTKEYVAKALLLSAHHIEALENDEYDKLPGTTYVIGYWRNYAALLKIDISESIELYKSKLEKSPSVVALEGGHHRAHKHEENARKRSGLIFFVLSAIFLTGIWYWQNPDDSQLNQWFDNQPNRQLEQLPGIDFNNDENQATREEGKSATVLESDPSYSNALPEPNFSDDLNETDVENRDATTTESVNNEDVQDASLGQQEQQQEQKVEGIQSGSIQSTENVGKPAAENPSTDSPRWIFLSIEKKSWLDVRDVVGDKLIYRIANVGESISLKGHPPFYVFVGTVDGVRVEYLGKPVSFKAEDGSLFARFRVGRVETKITDEQ